MELGPTSKTTPYNGSLLKFIRDSQKYTSSLSFFRQYIIWRYTIGSGAINYRLIFQKDNPNATYWVYLFFWYFKNTVNQAKAQKVKAADLLPKFREFLPWFNAPVEYQALHIDMKTKITFKVIGLYINELQSILQGSPTIQGSGFTVYKVSSEYPGLPKPGPSFGPTAVPQIPFNSTTISSDFNFAPFISPSGSSYLYSIFIPGGTKGPLFIDSDLHAYSSFEHEILLPHGVTFDISNYSTVTLDYIDPASINIKQLQSKDTVGMGNVYDLNEYAPTKGVARIQKKPFTIFETVLR